MTAPNMTPAPGAGSDPSLAGGTPSPEPESHAPPNEGAAASRADYVSRIRNEPDFAVEQVQQFQKTANQAETRLQKLESQLGTLKEMIDRGTSGEQIQQALQAYQAIASDPKLVPVLKTYFESGELRLPNGSGEPDVEDDYKTPEERRIETLEAEIRTLRGEFHGTESSFAMQQLAQHIERAAQEYGVSGEDLEKARSSIEQSVRGLASTEQGRGQIKNIVGENGYRTVRSLFADVIGPEGLLRAAESQVLRKQSARSRFTTDGPSQIGTSGEESPLPKFSSGAKGAQEALEFFLNHPERNPHRQAG